MTLVLSIALYFALRGAIRQWWHDLGAEARAARVRVGQRTSAFKRRHRAYHPGRLALTTGAVAAYTLRGTYRAAAFTGRSLWTGARAGWAEGKQRAEARAARRAATGFATTGTTAADPPVAAAPTPPEHVAQARPAGHAARIDQDAGHPAGERQAPPTQGGSMTSPTVDSAGEAVNIAAARAALDAIVKAADQAVSTIDNLSASMHGADMDSDTLSEVAAVLEAATAMQAAASKARNGLDDRHAVMEEAVNATPHAAKTDFYRH